MAHAWKVLKNGKFQNSLAYKCPLLDILSGPYAPAHLWRTEQHKMCLDSVLYDAITTVPPAEAGAAALEDHRWLVEVELWKQAALLMKDKRRDIAVNTKDYYNECIHLVQHQSGNRSHKYIYDLTHQEAFFQGRN